MLIARRITYNILCLLILGHFSILKAEHTDVRFGRITINDGLSLSSVYCIFQDSKGFMWFGTEDGLNKYDGKNFTIYRAISNNSNSLSNKWIEIIYEDKQGIFWFGSRGGLTRFDPVSETFNQYQNSLPEPYQLLNDTVTQIHQISEEYLLIGTVKGLNQINLQTLECAPFALSNILNETSINCIESIDDNNYAIVSSRGVFQINKITGQICEVDFGSDVRVTTLFTHRNIVWIGTEEGIYYYNNSKCKPSDATVTAKKMEAFPNLNVEQILFDDLSNMWISASDGLYKTDSLHKLRKQISSLKLSHSLAIVQGKNLFKDNDGNIWFATHGDGLFRIDRRSNEIDNFKNNPCDYESLSENSINCIYQDKSGTLWFGTFGAGISVYNQFSQKFKLLRKDPMRDNTLASNFVWSVFEDSKGRIWIGTNDKGISVYTPETQFYTHFDHIRGNPGSLSHSSVRDIYEDSEGIIWVATDGGGLNKYDEKTRSFIHYYSDPENPNSISSNSVRVIYEDNSGILWIGTRKGLNRFDKNRGSFIHYLHSQENENSLSHNFIYSVIFQDSNDNLWIGTYGGGLNKLNIKQEKFEHFRNDPLNPNSLSDDVVFSIYEDPKGLLWIGTNSGLNQYDPSSKKFRRFGIDQGLPNEVVYGVVPDDLGNLWLSTNFGICRFNPNDSTTINYDVTHGLQSNEFNGGSFHKGYSGKIYFGGVYGLNIIDPDVIGAYEDNSKIVFSRLEILGNDVKVFAGDGNRKERNRVIKDSLNYYLQENISYSKEIILDYNIRYFSLEFVDLGNIGYTNTSYAYRMEGLDENWHNSGNRNYVSYANMKPGKYTFKVKSQQPDGTWSKSVAKLDIIITPPFWKTWWFLLFEVIVVLALAYSVYSYLVKLRTYRILKIQNERINTANKKLIKSEQNLKIINATKDKFFSIISHDLKNPFTSLLSISELMSAKYDSFDEEEKESSVQRIHKSIKQIYNLLQNLLTWSRAQSGKIQFSPSKFNISELLQENYSLYILSANKKKVRLLRNFQNDIMAYGDRDMINAVIRNLVNNGIKFTLADKSVELGIHDHKNEVEVYIKDEGVGISKESLQKLFRIDQQVKTIGTDGEKGTGLGLIICKEFIEKNKGRINVKSEPGKGSTFSFTVPK